MKYRIFFPRKVTEKTREFISATDFKEFNFANRNVQQFNMASFITLRRLKWLNYQIYINIINIGRDM